MTAFCVLAAPHLAQATGGMVTSTWVQQLSCRLTGQYNSLCGDNVNKRYLILSYLMVKVRLAVALKSDIASPYLQD